MTNDVLRETIAGLQADVHGLFTAELNDEPGKPERLKKAQDLNKQWLELQQQVDSLPPQDRKLLLLGLEDTKPDLIFLLASVDDTPDLVTLEDRVREINRESFELAKKSAGQPAAFAAQASELSQRLVDLLKEPGSSTADIQRLASDADLELEFILHSGNVPTSTRLASYLRGLNTQ